jgi:SPP1 gp7 family putative phage head morphogenesis protein
LLDFVQELIDATNEILIPMLPTLEYSADNSLGLVALDAWPDDLQTLLLEINNTVALAPWTDPVALGAFAYDVNTFSREDFNRLANSVLGVNIFSGEPWLATTVEAFAIENANLITSIKGEYLNDVSVISFEGLKTGTPASQIATEIEGRYGVTESRANLIARDQISKLNGQIDEYRQVDAGITSYTWQTSEDDAVRPSHEVKNGNTYDWDSPPADTGHPGQDYQCRCVAIPNFETITNGT